MLYSNQRCNPTSHFCFARQNKVDLLASGHNYFTDRSEFESAYQSTIIAPKEDETGATILYCYNVPEASNVIKVIKESPCKLKNQSIESIFAIETNQYIFLARTDQDDFIYQSTIMYQPDSEPIFHNFILHQNKPPNPRITFILPIFSIEGRFNNICYAAGSQLIKQNDRPVVVSPSSEKRFINCAAILQKKKSEIYAIGVDTNILLYDAREQKKIVDFDVHYGGISAVSVNHLDENILYTGGYDGFVKQFDIRNLTNNEGKINPLYEVCTGPTSLPQCSVVNIAPNPIDKSVFATAASGNINNGYVRIFKNGDLQYNSSQPLNKNLKQEEVFRVCTTENKVIWIDWSNFDPSLLVSEDINHNLNAHYYVDLDFDGLLSDL